MRNPEGPVVRKSVYFSAPATVSRPLVAFGRLAVLPRRGATGWLKRMEDLLLCVVLLALLWPVFLLIGCAIEIDTPGPVLFRQARRGFNGHTIRVFKFRTMHAHCTDLDAREQTRRADPRVTRVGRFLRRSSLDELPQLFNVLSGDMSVVGPRPHAFGTMIDGRRLESIVDAYMTRYEVRPGITGWAQVNGWRGSLDADEQLRRRVEHDLYYIQHWSLRLDLRIIASSVKCVFCDDNAW